MLSQVASNKQGDVMSPCLPAVSHLYGKVPDSTMHEQHQIPHAAAQLQGLLLIPAGPVHSTTPRELHACHRLYAAVLCISNDDLQMRRVVTIAGQV